MNDVVFYEQPSKYIVESTEYDDKYTTPVLTPGKSFILGYTKETKGVFNNIPTIIFDDFTTESKYVDFIFKVKSSAMKILNCSNLINIKFIYYLLQVINIDTTTHKRHWLSNYEYMIIPIPCKKMQDKIVNRIESLFNRVNEIDNHYNRIDKLKSILKSKIIDLAIKGKLTKQLSSDEPSSKLIENIIEEKHKLMAEGKIKKENLSIIYKDSDNQFYEKFDDGKVVNIINELQFKIPKEWNWVRLNCSVRSIFAGGDKPKLFSKDKTDYFNIPVISNGEKNNGIFGYTDKATVNNKAITVSSRGTIGYTVIRNEPFVPIVRLITILPFNNLIDIEYLKIVINYFVNGGKGSAVQQLTVPMISPTLLPIPPLEEQKRIVNIVSKLFSIIKTAE